VNWEMNGYLPTAYDWIGYYKRTRGETKEYYSYEWTKGASSGFFDFAIPSKLGICEFRFCRGSEYKPLARSTPISVGPQVNLSLRVEGDKLSITRSQLSGNPSTWDWIALFRSETTDNRFYEPESMRYLSTRKEVTELVNRPRTPGKYVAKFIPAGGGYSETAISNEITIDNTDSLLCVKREGPPAFFECVFSISSVVRSSRDWVALYHVGETNPYNYVGSYQWAAENTFSLSFPVPNESEGKAFEFRFFSRGSLAPVRVSPSFTV